jgi:hypothetical protein
LLLDGCTLDSQPNELTASTESAVLVQSCPGYGSCASWSAPEDVGPQYCTYGNGECGYYCDPVPGRPDYCDLQILPTDECCNWAPNPATYTTMQSYQDCWDIHGNNCVQIDQTPSFVGCGC